MTHFPHYPSRRSNNAAAAGGCAFLILWFVGVLLTLAFWGLVAWGIWEGIQWLQRN